ncbi:MAG: hypothetical protein ACT4PI_17275 [Actinomycetota bacterium]
MGRTARWARAVLGAGVALVALVPVAGSAGEDQCAYLPASDQVEDSSAGNPCLANVVVGGGIYEVLIHRLEAPDPGLSSTYLRPPAAGRTDFAVPGLGDTARAWREAFVVTGPDYEEIVVQFSRGCHVAQVVADTELGGDQQTVVALASDVDGRVPGDGSCAGAGGGTTATTATTAPPATAAPTTAAAAGKPLCTEAQTLLEGYTPEELAAAGITDPLHTSIVLDDTDLLPAVQNGLRAHDQAYPGARAYAKDGFESASNILWVYGIHDTLGRAFSRSFVTGQERALVQQIQERARQLRAEGNDTPFSPGAVLAAAVELHGGDVTEALLTAHNTMRALAGSPAPGLESLSSDDLFDDELAPVKGSANAEALAQFFGSAYLEMSVQGSWGAQLTGHALTLLSGNPAFSVVGIVGDELLEALAERVIGGNAGTSITARVYHGLADFSAQAGGIGVPDPEQFCFSVWSAQIGKQLYDALPYAGTRIFNGPAFADVAPADPTEKRFLNVLESPFSVEFSGPDGQLRLVQGATLDDARIAGSLPNLFVPVPEDTTWGAGWLGVEEPGGTVVFEATAAGAVLHYVRTDVDTGSTAYFETTAVAAGDRYTVTTDAASLMPVMTGPNGERIEPILLQLDLTGSFDRTGEDDDDGGSSLVPIVAGVAGVVVLVGGAILLWERRRRRQGAIPGGA